MAVATLTVLGFLASCGPAPTPVGPASESGPAPRLVAMFESLAGQLEAAGSACEAVAGTLEAWNAGSGQGYGQLATEAEASALGDAEGAILDRRLEEAMERIAASAQRCPDHPRLAAAFEQFDRVVDFE